MGSGSIRIPASDITSRELLLVIPENKLSEANEALLAAMPAEAKAKGISLVIKRYGTKPEAIFESDANSGTTEN